MDKFPTCNRQQRNSGESPAQSAHAGVDFDMITFSNQVNITPRRKQIRRDVETEPRTRAGRRPIQAVYQVAVDEQIRTSSPETETLEDIISNLLPMPVPPKPRDDPIPSNRDLLVQRLLGTLAPSKAVVQERSAVTELETMLLNWLPVRTVTEDNVVSPGGINSFRQRMFFMRSIDAHDRKLPDSG